MSQILKLTVFTSLAAALSAAGLITRLSNANADSILLADLARPFVVITLGTMVLAAGACIFSRRLFALMPAVVFLLFSYRTSADLFPEAVPGNWAAAGLLLIICALIFYLARKVEPVQLAKAEAALFFIMAAPFALPLFGLLTQAPPPTVSPAFVEYAANARALRASPDNLPDVIYIVPDRYGSADVLKDKYNFDNTSFYEQLARRGFSVNGNARANYPTTAHSMASTTNSGYLTPFVDVYGTQSNELQPLFRTIEDSPAQAAMRRLGYRFVNAGSWWDASRFNRNADENYGVDIFDDVNRVSLSEFEYILFGDTPARDLPGFSSFAKTSTECRRIKRKLDWLSKAGNQQKPIFVLAHMVIPHSPITTDRDGNCLETAIDYPQKKVDWAKFTEGYADYTHYFNTAILNVIDRQLAARKDNGRELVFVIQADEGPYPKKTRLQANNQSFIDLSMDELDTKTGILNAIYLGGTSTVSSDDLKTPINNWRIILEHITGQPAGRNEHKVFIYKDHQHIHDYVEMTEKLLD